MAEGEKKKGGGAGKFVGGSVFGAAAAVAVMFFMNGGEGFGLGKGSGKTETAPAPAASVSSSQEAEPAAAEVKYVDVTIKEDKYVYNGGEYDIDGLIAELKKLTGGENVRISDNGGLAESLDSLKKALGDNGIKYSDETAK